MPSLVRRVPSVETGFEDLAVFVTFNMLKGGYIQGPPASGETTPRHTWRKLPKLVFRSAEFNSGDVLPGSKNDLSCPLRGMQVVAADAVLTRGTEGPLAPPRGEDIHGAAWSIWIRDGFTARKLDQYPMHGTKSDAAQQVPHPGRVRGW